MHDPPLEQHPFLKILAATEAAAAAGEAKPGACFTPKLSPHWQSALQLQETPPEEQPFDLIPLKFSVAEQQPLVRILVASETEEDPPPEQQPFLQLFFVAEAIANWNLESEEHERNVTTTKKTDTGPSANTLK